MTVPYLRSGRIEPDERSGIRETHYGHGYVAILTEDDAIGRIEGWHGRRIEGRVPYQFVPFSFRFFFLVACIIYKWQWWRIRKGVG